MIATTYRLACGHAATVPGPMGATTGRAWCDSCAESVPVAHELPRGAEPRTCELCGGPDPIGDCHGDFCKACRDADERRCIDAGEHGGPSYYFGASWVCNRHAIARGIY